MARNFVASNRLVASKALCRNQMYTAGKLVVILPAA